MSSFLLLRCLNVFQSFRRQKSSRIPKHHVIISKSDHVLMQTTVYTGFQILGVKTHVINTEAEETSKYIAIVFKKDLPNSVHTCTVNAFNGLLLSSYFANPLQYSNIVHFYFSIVILNFPFSPTSSFTVQFNKSYECNHYKGSSATS